MTKSSFRKALPLLVLAGGFGTRLQPVLGHIPKALAPVKGKPFLHYQIEHWIKQGINSFIFLLHHQAKMIIDFLEEEKRSLFGACQIQYVVEPEPMGTGGAVAYALKQLPLNGDFLLTNADTWLGAGFRELMEMSSPAILVIKVDDVGRYGGVEFNQNGVVTSFSEKTKHGGSGWVNAGMCRMSEIYFQDRIKQQFSIESDIYPELVYKELLKAHILHADFIDIGIPAEYARICRWIESKKRIAL